MLQAMKTSPPTCPLPTRVLRAPGPRKARAARTTMQFRRLLAALTAVEAHPTLETESTLQGIEVVYFD